MRLIVEAPEGWTERATGDDSSAKLACDATSLVIHARRLVTKPRDLEAWATSSIHADANADESRQLEVVSETRHKTTLGWPVHVIETKVSPTEASGQEARIDAFYAFLDVVCHLTAQASVADLEQQRAELESIILGARPDLWPDEIVALDQLWQS